LIARHIPHIRHPPGSGHDGSLGQESSTFQPLDRKRGIPLASPRNRAAWTLLQIWSHCLQPLMKCS
jgi:hypothetical protein